MKKLLFLIILFLSSLVVRAQFGNLKDVLKQEEKGVDTTTESTNNPKEDVLFDFTILEESLKDGFCCIKQDFQLEDTITGKHYNYGDAQKRFGGETSFLVLFDNGFILSEKILYPWEYDRNYPDYKNKQYKPVINKTSFLKVGQKGWKSDGLFEPKEEGSFANGLKYAKMEQTIAVGLKRATGYGKKEVWIVWLLLSEGEDGSESICEFLTQKTELTIEKDNKSYKMERPDTKKTVLGGIVVEPMVGGIGTINVALVGVVSQYDDEYKMALVVQHETGAGSGTLIPDDSY